MKEKKQVKINLKIAILIVCIILLIIFGTVILIYHIETTPSSSITSSTGLTSTTTIYSDTKKTIPEDSNIEYITHSSTVYSTYSSDIQLDNIFVTSNSELEEYLYKCIGTDLAYMDNENEEKSISQFFNDEFFEKYNLAIEMYDSSSTHDNYSIVSVVKDGSNSTINIKDNFYTYSGPLAPSSTLVFVALDKEINNVNFDIYRTTIDNSHESNYEMMFIAGIIISIATIIIVSIIVSNHNRKVDEMYNVDDNSKKNNSIKKIIICIVIVILILLVVFFAIIFYESVMMPNTIAYKPIIYLYPNEEMKLSVKLVNSENITCSYPKYVNNWNVFAKPNGDLLDLNTGRSLYSLYYESKNVVKFDVKEDGFIVKGEDAAKFLEEKLAILGLNEREAEEFIIYWLPKLESNKYNYIRFATKEEINENMPLEFSLKPDTVIRVLMTYKGLEKPMDVQEQQLVTPSRTGFVAVEWGGTEIK